MTLSNQEKVEIETLERLELSGPQIEYKKIQARLCTRPLGTGSMSATKAVITALETMEGLRLLLTGPVAAAKLLENSEDPSSHALSICLAASQHLRDSGIIRAPIKANKFIQWEILTDTS